MSKDRFSIHQESGGPLTQEAFTIMRDGGTVANSGLVGITNKGYAEGGEPFLPETIFNTQASGDSYIRFSSGPTGVYNLRSTSAISILGNGNTRASGIQFTYYPDCDDATLEPCVGEDCPDPNPTYRKYSLETCGDTPTTIYVYNNTNLAVNVNDVVSYEDENGNTGCATVKGYTLTTSSKFGLLTQNFGPNGCTSCEGGDPDETPIHFAVICGTSDVVALSNTNNFDISSNPVVKFDDPNTSLVVCATLNGNFGYGSAYANIQGIATGGCGDPDCGSLPPANVRYRVELCDGLGTRYLVDDNSGNDYPWDTQDVYVLVEGPDLASTCARIEEETTDTGPEDIVSMTLGEFFGSCDCQSRLIDRYWFQCCDAPYDTYAWTVFNTADFDLSSKCGESVQAKWTYVSNGQSGPDQPGWPPNGTILNGVLSNNPHSCPQASEEYESWMELRAITSTEGDCDNPPANTFRKYTIDPCDEARALDHVTEDQVANPTPKTGVVKYTVDGGSTEICGTILSHQDSQPEIANTSIITSYGTGSDKCDLCEGIVGPNNKYYFVNYVTCSAACDGPNDVPCQDCCDWDSAMVQAPDCDHADLMSGGAAGNNWHKFDLNGFADGVYGYICKAYDALPEGYTVEGTIVCPPSPMQSPSTPHGGDTNTCWTQCVSSCGGVLGDVLCNAPAGGETPTGSPGFGGGVGGGFGSMPEQRYGTSNPNEGGDTSVTINSNGDDQIVADIALVRATGTEGFDMGHLSFSERGYVGIGLTRTNKTTTFIPNAPLTVNYAGYQHRDSGTISMREQSTSPNYNGNYGKIYVKEFTGLGGSQALFFKDDTGVETNLLLSTELPDDSCCELIQDYEGPSGMVFGDVHGNTYAGWHTPESRVSTATITKNTLFGWAAGYDMSKGSPDFNTFVGYTAGSGGTVLQKNTVLGSESLVNYNEATSSVIIGYGNVKSSTPVFAPVDPEDDISLPTSCIIIGTELFVNNDPPTGILAIGHGITPVVTGQTIGSSKNFSVNDATFIVSTGDNILSISSDAPGLRYTTKIDVRDETSTGTTTKNDLKFNFSNSENFTKTLLHLEPNQALRPNIPSYTDQGFQYAQLNGDFRLQGAIRFQDGSSLSGVPNWLEDGLYATSGTNFVEEANGLWSVLDFSELGLADDVVQTTIDTSNTFVALQLDGTSSSNVGKMSLGGLSDYLTEAASPLAENCNVIISNAGNEANIDAAANANSVMIGCDVATFATGWKNSIIIGTEAGKNATIPNPTLGTSTASIFLGYRAGYESDDVDNGIFIGTSAGRDAEAATDSIFVGASAGLSSNYNNSIGIGQNALRGRNGSGTGNIEIVTNLLNNQRLLHNAGTVNNKLNIQNIIAGDTAARNLSIGDARLSPESPLEVRRDVTVHGSNPNNFIQAWYCDDSLVGAVECDGSLSGFMVEGILDGNLQPAASISSPSPANLSVYYNGNPTGQTAVIINRDANFSASQGDYILAVRMGGEYRPVTNNTGGGAAIP